MRYKEDNDNRYRVNFMRATEELMDALTVESFISYLEENAEFEDNTVEYIDGKCVKCRAYDLTEENSKLHKEFLVTEDGRVFYWRTLLDKIELVDDEIPEGMVEGLQEGNMFTVYLKSAGGTKKYFTEFETEAEAESFCREYGWEWVDENEFVWDMDYEEE